MLRGVSGMHTLALDSSVVNENTSIIFSFEQNCQRRAAFQLQSYAGRLVRAEKILVAGLGLI